MKKFLIAGLFVLGLGAVALTFAIDTKAQTSPAPVQATQTPVPTAKTPAPAATKVPNRTLTVNDDGKTISVTVGDTIAIKLDSNPSTGYGWQVTGISTASAVQNGKIEFESPPPPKDGRIRVGQGGTAVITFDAVSAGKSTISLEYRRPWEKGKAPARTFTITLDVK